ncbi:hypothetical protein CesoFtcFv8_005292 [Champsocephalus esox]|uniref:Uncharacterized protein n=1 Tax=Champsocephalus esox TaxID=159716 RepID=A0AAN8CNF8_9TELE|nr:hypothetical protein CesoFtcFv8_005292 [Champsocephalus esox]
MSERSCSPLRSVSLFACRSTKLPDKIPCTYLLNTAVSREDTAESREDTAVSGEDTAESREDTAVSREDTAVSREDTAVSREDSERIQR